MVDEHEDCVGLLTAQDLLRGGRPAKRMRKPLFIPEAAQLSQVLELFQTQRSQAGVVVDEYGGTAGLLTMAHIGNELLGHAVSEDLPDLPEPEQLAPNRWRLSGRMPWKAGKPWLVQTTVKAAPPSVVLSPVSLAPSQPTATVCYIAICCSLLNKLPNTALKC